MDYDPEETSYSKLLEMFWKNHDPTSKCSRQYMSVIFYFDNEQKQLAEDTMKEEKKIKKSIETKLLPAKEFYPAEDYHQKYLLQQHPFLCNALDLVSAEDIIASHVGARINGYVGGYGCVPKFDKEWSHWGITEQMADYIRKQIIYKASH